MTPSLDHCNQAAVINGTVLAVRKQNKNKIMETSVRDCKELRFPNLGVNSFLSNGEEWFQLQCIRAAPVASSKLFLCK